MTSGGRVKYVPGVLGALLVCVGLALLLPPLAVIAAGMFLLALDRRMT
jgi:hypothetical protein